MCLRSLLFVCAVGCTNLLACSTPLATAQPALTSPKALAKAIDTVLADTIFENSIWGIRIVELESGRILYDRNERKSFMPASNTKLYTTAAVLDQLGPDYQYRTVLYTDGRIEDGVLRGNLIVKGSGDPVFGDHYKEDADPTAIFRTWADSLKVRGIHHIEGDIIGDDDVFDDEPFGREWTLSDLPYYYAAEISGLTFNDNVVDFEIEARQLGEPAVIRWDPLGTNYVSVTNATRTISSAGFIEEGYERPLGSNVFEISSLVPQGRIDEESLTISNATLYFVHVLRETLIDEGIVVSGRPVDVDDLSIKPRYVPGHLQRLATHTSAPMSEIIVPLNKDSNNLYAEQLLRTLGTEHPIDDDDLAPGSDDMGLAAMTTTLVRADVDTTFFRLVDGSGLSRLNLVTPEMTAALLRYMGNHPDVDVREAYLNSLPIAGVDGTLEHRMRIGPAHGAVRAKTGTLTGASALSGYAKTAVRTPLVFVFMSNNYTTPTRPIRQAQDRIIDLLVRYHQ